MCKKGQSFVIKVERPNQFFRLYKVCFCTKIGSIMEEFGRKIETPVESFDFYYDGRKLSPDDTPKDLDLREGSVIDCFRKQVDTDEFIVVRLEARQAATVVALLGIERQLLGLQ